MAPDLDIKALLNRIAILESRIAQLEQENDALRRCLGLDSSNSSKPPSSDGLAKKPCANKPGNKSLRGKSGKKSGGQKGHKGDTLRQTETPDKVERHQICECAHCQTKLDTSNVINVEKRQVFDMPKPKLEVTEHRADISKCPKCGKITKAPFPNGVNAPAQYGPRIKSAAIYFNVQQLIPEDRTADIMTDLFGAPTLCPASVTAWADKKAKEFEPVIEAIKEQLKRDHVRHLDETGFRIGGKTQWLHTVSSTIMTCYVTSEKRGDIPIFLQDGSGDVIVHDHFKPYYKRFGSLDHALCNAHHLRELKALMEHDEEPWAFEMYAFLLAVNALVGQAQEKTMPNLPPLLLECIARYYNCLVDMGLSFHRALPPLKNDARGGRKKRRPGHNLLRRLRDFKSDVLRFAEDFSVPFTNNLAEQDIRMMKLRMKISGGFRSPKGAQVFAALRSVISTARKHGWDILDTLSTKPCTLVNALRTA